VDDMVDDMKDFGRILPAIVLAAILTATGTVSARADSADDLRQAAIAEIEAAGSSAGLVRACGVDPTPITAAVKDLLKRVPLSPPTQAALLVSYEANETRMTQNTLAIPGAPPCGDLRILVQDTVRDLNAVGQPESPEAEAPSTTASLDD
jgi:hypothetical protein